ncbi:hypothetical protein D3C87_1054940 [compost metagenome]
MVRCENRHAVRQYIQATGHGMAQCLLAVHRQQVISGLVVQAHMHMHAAARVLQVRLGHETGAVVVLERHATGAAAKQGGPVGGAQAVVRVAKIDFKLARPQLGGDYRGIDTLRPRGLDHFIEHWGKPRQAFDVHVWLVIGITRQRIAGKLRQTITQLAVEQIELQLERHHRENAFAFESVQHLRQHFTRLEDDRLFCAIGGDEHLPQWLFLPAHQLERARHQATQRIRVAVVEAIVTDLEQPALSAKQHTVLRQLERTAGGDFFEHFDRVALAVEMPGNVQGNQVDVAHIGVALTKPTHFGQQIRAHSIHHFVPCCFYQV